MRHPWLDGLDWLVEASDRLLAALDEGDRIHIVLERGKDVSAEVVIDTRRTQDQLDDLPGLRRIERRATELADQLPATRIMQAYIDLDGDIVANVHDDSGVMMTLISHRPSEGGWRSADGIVIPRRILDPPITDMVTAEPWILDRAKGVLGDGRMKEGIVPISMHHRQNEMLLIVLPAGSLLPPRRTEAT